MITTLQLSENSHQGFDGLKSTLSLASMQAKSNTASGMPLRLRRNGIRSRCTGKERDAETGLDFFLARYYSGAQGRFLSPDEWKGGPDDGLTEKDISQPGPLPYADISNPQSLNKYTYVINNPLRYVDPDGHEEKGANFLDKESAIKIAIATKLINVALGVASGIMGELIWLKPNTSDEKMGASLCNVFLTGMVGPEKGSLEAALTSTETLTRLGKSSESAARLGRKALEAEERIGIHGVSSTAAKVEGEISTASRSAVEQSFKVHNTPSGADQLHRTIELPKPVTKTIADIFNKLFGH
jgi:RHS repeat-associated protein